jgi:GNAT superfamily N-acetyltransferase
MEGYTVAAEIPSIEDYRRLRSIAGLSAKSAEQATIGLPNSITGVVVRHQGTAVGMGRVIGDGGLFFQVVDIAVDPAHQGNGLGKAVMAALMDWLRANVPAGGYVSLIADGEAHRLYAQYGFRPTAPVSIGMALTL